MPKYILKKDGWLYGEKFLKPGDEIELTEEKAEQFKKDGIILEEVKESEIDGK